MFNQKVEAVLEDVQPVSIHGQRYYDIRFRVDSTESGIRRARAPFEEVYANPQPGDEVIIHALLGTVTKIEKRETDKAD
ncbi:MAG: hypothetical protein GF372_13135 [Candidatus Marinimicrobia bacterium]|nr:hypothetical protein [Candidatus Neomarinimicrobiota bacterium]